MKKAVSVPVIGVAVFPHPAYTEQALAEGKLDFVGSPSSTMLPNGPIKPRKGGSRVEKMHSCLYCMERLMEAESPIPCGCAINTTGRELGTVSLNRTARTGCCHHRRRPASLRQPVLRYAV